MFDKFLKIAPFVFVFLVMFETYMAITAATIPLALFHVFAACVNGLYLYYLQTRNHI